MSAVLYLAGEGRIYLSFFLALIFLSVAEVFNVIFQGHLRVFAYGVDERRVKLSKDLKSVQNSKKKC